MLKSLAQGITKILIVQGHQRVRCRRISRPNNGAKPLMFRIRQWQEAGCEARMNAAWDLVLEYWVGKKGKNPDELRLQKSVTRVLRQEGGWES